LFIPQHSEKELIITQQENPSNLLTPPSGGWGAEI